MAQLNGVRIDTRGINLVIEYFINNADWRKVFKGLMPVKTLKTWYPTWDANAFAFKDDREVFKKKSGLETPKKVDFEMTTNEITLEAYQLMNHIPYRDIKEASAMEINDLAKIKLQFMATKVNNWLNRDLFAIFGNAALWPNAAAANA